MMVRDPDAFNQKAHEWAVLHAGAPKNDKYSSVAPRAAAPAAPQQIDESR